MFAARDAQASLAEEPDARDKQLDLVARGAVDFAAGAGWFTVELLGTTIELRTDGVLRSPHAKEYNAASRLYGLVNSNLMWAMDMAAVGQPLQSHLSAELKRVG